MKVGNTVETQRSRRTRREVIQGWVCCVGSAFAPFGHFVANRSAQFRKKLSADSHTLLLPVLVAGFVLFVSACGNRAQQQAYERAVQAEQQMTVENAPALLADYQRVIALDTRSSWARKAGERIAAIEARVKAEELHKTVFQEHGVD